MNDFKKALIDVVGDLSDSERNVKRALQGKKRAPKRNFFVVPVFIMALCLIGFTLWLLPNKVEQQATDSFKNDYLFDYYMASEQIFTNADQQSEEEKQAMINSAFRNYQTAIAIQAYAKSQGLTYTKQQYEEREQQLTALYNEAANPFFEHLKNVSGTTREQYQTHVMPLLIENVFYTTQLDKKWLAENPKLLEDFVGTYTEKLANDYLTTNFERELTATKAHYQVTGEPNYGASVPKSGTVAAMEGKMIYFIQNATDQEIQQMTSEELHALKEDRLKAWLINYDDTPVQVGDFIRVSVDGTTTSYVAQLTNGIAENIEIMFSASEQMTPEIQLTGDNATEWQQLTSYLQWQPHYNVTNYLTPRYTVQIENRTYTVFENDYNHFFLVPYGDQTIAKLPQGQTKKLASFLSQFATK